MTQTYGGGRHEETAPLVLEAVVVAGILAIILAFGVLSSGTDAASSVIATNLSGSQLVQVAYASCDGMAAYGRVLTMDGQTIRTPNIRYRALAKIYTKSFDTQARRATVESIDAQG